MTIDTEESLALGDSMLLLHMLVHGCLGGISFCALATDVGLWILMFLLLVFFQALAGSGIHATSATPETINK